MLTVTIPNDHVKERTYVVRVLLEHYCGIPVDVITQDSAEDYMLRWDNKSIRIADAFFGKIKSGTSYPQTTNLPEKVFKAQSALLHDITILYGEDHVVMQSDKIDCHADLFAGAFFMLTRWEEALPVEKDQYTRFPAKATVAVREGFILRPVVDEYCQLIRKWLERLNYPMPKETNAFRIVPTCDVDIPFFWRGRPVWKALGGLFRKHFNPIKSLKDYRDYKHVQEGKAKDPYDTFSDMMSWAEKRNLTFEFNFIAGGNTKYEGYYVLNEPSIQKLLVEIKQRNHKIGLHPSFDTYLDAEQIRKEKSALEEATGTSVRASRQHFLRFQLPVTWRNLAEAGLEEDCSMGYAAEPGFRCGTSRPFPVFDIHQRRQLNLIERPLLVMDVSLRFYKKLSIEESIALCKTIKSEVQKHNGEFIFLWHNSTLSEIDDWQPWQSVFASLMEEPS